MTEEATLEGIRTTVNFDIEKLLEQSGWGTTPPESLTLPEALRIFVEGMEFANQTQERATHEAFRRNLKLVLDNSAGWFESLRQRKVPVHSMFLRPASLFRFDGLVSIDSDYFVSADMLSLYEDADRFAETVRCAQGNLRMSVSFMAKRSEQKPNEEMTAADGYFFRYCQE